MIQNETEYQKAMAINEEERRRIDGLVEIWKKHGLSDAEVKRLSDPMMSLHLQFVEEAETWRKEHDGTELMADKDEMLSKAVRFDMGRSQFHQVFVEARRGRDTVLWAVRRGDSVLNTDGEWEYEPMSSHRDNEFLDRTRFDFNDAWARAEAVVKNDG